jgi:hypothetical protein
VAPQLLHRAHQVYHKPQVLQLQLVLQV